MATLNWIRATQNHASAPFMVIDKRYARLWVFDAQARLQATSPVLLGLALGDDSVPGIGTRPMALIRPHERTTPAGRFVVEPGRNAAGEDIFWIDYNAAISIHRVRAKNHHEQRIQRLASQDEADNRISYGCINVPKAFYNLRLKPTFSRQLGIVYVLPETRPVQTLFVRGGSILPG
jgi:hypothetical protein